ncbi:MAG: hypothetical protein ACIAS6_02755 [Phycisphaerales bacterium JB060]
MSERVCYIERDERGDRIRAVRLIGQHAEAVWTSPRVDGRYATEADEDASAAAEWIAQRLSLDGDHLGLIVLDTCGAHCGWVQSPTAEAGAVRGAYGRGSEAIEDDFSSGLDFEEEPEDSEALGARSTPMEAAIEPLGAAYESPMGLRVGVLVASDAVVRLLIDALDAQGVVFSGVASLWHAVGWMASPDDGNSSDSGRVVADSPTVTCGVLVQPEGRLLWAWCRDRTVLAAGSIRLGIHDDGPMVTRQDVARLVNDWVAWSAQIGTSPGRIVISSYDLVDERATGIADTLSAAGVATAIAEAWPEAVLDIDVQEDPVRDVLRATSGRGGSSLSSGQGLSSLAMRPSRSTRRVYQFAGLAMACAGIALAALGYRWQSQAPAVRADAARVRDGYMADIAAVEQKLDKPGEIAGAVVPFFKLTSEVDQATRASEIRRPEGKPILLQMEMLSDVLRELGGDVELQRIDASGAAGFIVQLSTEDSAIVGRINALISDLGMNDGPLRWQANASAQGSRYTVRMAGTWQRQGGQP